jgi:hypothetical protein
VGGIWKRLEMQTREALECCEQSSVDESAGSSEDQNADRNVDSKDCAHGFQIGMRSLFGMDYRPLLYYMLAKNL